MKQIISIGLGAVLFYATPLFACPSGKTCPAGKDCVADSSLCVASSSSTGGSSSEPTTTKDLLGLTHQPDTISLNLSGGILAQPVFRSEDISMARGGGDLFSPPVELDVKNAPVPDSGGWTVGSAYLSPEIPQPSGK